MRLKMYLRPGTDNQSCPKFLSVGDLNKAEKAIIQVIQRETFSEEISALENGIQVSSKSPTYKLNPVMHEGLLRVGGRISKAPISFDAKHPIILPYRHHVTELIIQAFHE